MKDNFLPAYFFISEESLLLEDEVSRLKEDLSDFVDFSWDYFSFGSDNCDIVQILESLTGFPLGNKLRLVIISNCQALDSDQASSLKSYMGSPMSSSVLVLTGNKIGSCSGLKKIIEKTGGVKELKKPKGNSLAQWIQQKTSALDKTIKPSAALKLIELAGDDLQTLSKELEKLALGSSGVEITIVHVIESASSLPQAKIFELIDSIIEKKRVRSFDLLSPVINDSGSLPLISLLRTRYRQMTNIKSVIKKEGSPPAAVLAKKLNLHSFVAEKLKKQSSLYSLKDLVRVFNEISKAELNIKTGLDHFFAMENLVLEISKK